MNKDEKTASGRFEVRKGGKVYQSGPVSLMPDAETRKQMWGAGYGVFVDGKAYGRPKKGARA